MPALSILLRLVSYWSPKMKNLLSNLNIYGMQEVFIPRALEEARTPEINPRVPPPPNLYGPVGVLIRQVKSYCTKQKNPFVWLIKSNFIFLLVYELMPCNLPTNRFFSLSIRKIQVENLISFFYYSASDPQNPYLDTFKIPKSHMHPYRYSS